MIKYLSAQLPQPMAQAGLSADGDGWCQVQVPLLAYGEGMILPIYCACPNGGALLPGDVYGKSQRRRRT
jgi:hypothetical protein